MTPQRKPLARRAFSGLAGSPLAVAVEVKPEPTQPAPRKRGRPRKHADNARKQAAHRVKKSIAETVVQTEESAVSKGKLHGESSYDDDGLAKIEAKLTRLELYGGKRAPQASGPDKMKPGLDDTGELRMKRLRFPKTWGLSDQEKAEAIEKLARRVIFRGEESQTIDGEQQHGTLRCRVHGCGFVCDFWSQAIAHLDREYQRGVNETTTYNRMVRDPDHDDPLMKMVLRDLRKQIQNNGHLQIVAAYLKEIAPGRRLKRKTPATIHLKVEDDQISLTETA